MGREGERERERERACGRMKRSLFDIMYYLASMQLNHGSFFIPVSLLLSVVNVVLFCLYRYTSFHNHDVSTDK